MSLEDKKDDCDCIACRMRRKSEQGRADKTRDMGPEKMLAVMLLGAMRKTDPKKAAEMFHDKLLLEFQLAAVKQTQMLEEIGSAAVGEEECRLAILGGIFELALSVSESPTEFFKAFEEVVGNIGGVRVQTVKCSTEDEFQEQIKKFTAENEGVKTH